MDNELPFIKNDFTNDFIAAFELSRGTTSFNRRAWLTVAKNMEDAGLINHIPEHVFDETQPPACVSSLGNSDRSPCRMHDNEAAAD